MNNLLELQEKNGRTILSYHYKRIQEIDDVILDLLAEADIEGFVRGHLNKANSTVDYDVTGYMALASIQKTPATAEILHSILNNLYRLLAYLEDSFIDEDYVLFDKDHIFFDQDTKKLHLIVLPCQGMDDSSIDLSECVKNIIDNFIYEDSDDQAYADQVRIGMNQKMHSLIDMQDIIDLDRVDTGKPMDWELKTADSVYDEMSQAGNPAEYKDIENENVVEDEPANAVVEVTEEKSDEELEQESLDIVEALTEHLKEELRMEVEAQVREGVRAEVEAQVREDIRAEVEAQVREDVRAEVEAQVREDVRAEVEAQVREDVRAEVETQVREDVRAEVEAQVREDVRAEVETQVREDVRAEVETQVREELRAEVEAQVREELYAEALVQEADQKTPYLIRRKTGEVIQLNKGTFVLGKMEACCDYVIDSRSVSRMHALIKYNEITDDYSIVDCNSTNHSYLNGKQIPAEIPFILKDGMHIHLALEEFIFQICG